MSVARNIVLQEIKDQIAALSGYEAERVHIRPVSANEIIEKPHVAIVADKEANERLDNNETRRRLRVVIGVFAPIDPLSNTDADLQVNEFYEPVHAKLETLRDGVAGKFQSLEEDPDGPDFETIYGQVPLRMVACSWTVFFQRPMGATG